MTTAAPLPVGTRTLFLQAFVGIAALFAATNIVAVVSADALREKSRTLVQDMLASIQLVSRMGQDLDRVRLLLDSHIFESEQVGRARVAALERDYAVAALAYEPLATQPGEERTWRKLQAEVTALEAPIEDALALSRRNRDLDAREALLRLEQPFAEIDKDITALIRINRGAADRTVELVDERQAASMALFGGLALLGIILSLLVGVRVLRLVQQREEQVRRHAAMLEDQNRDLDAFACRVSHDLRGPLTSINLATSRLAAGAQGEAAAIGILQRGVKRMGTLIDDLLALSRSEADDQPANCDPAHAAAQLREELAERLVAEDVLLRAEVESATVLCGEGLLRQVLWNLADNAVKYRRPGISAEVEIRGRIAGRGYDLRVRDNGLGMGPDDVSHAFDPFYRAQRTRGLPGTGLGLSIVKRVIERCGGTVSVESSPGHGTTFVIDLPLGER